MLLNSDSPAPHEQPQPVPLDWLRPPEPTATATDGWDIASPLRRGIALLIDLFILGLALGTAPYIFGERTTELMVRDGEPFIRTVFVPSPWHVRVVLLGWFGYLIVTERLFEATLGKRLTGIWVVKVDFSPISVKAAVLRQLTHLVPLVVLPIPPIAPYLVGSIIALVSQDRRRRGDRLAGTLVVRYAPVPVPIAQTATGGAHLDSAGTAGR
jgi:uncharacterized RDD family membrane protein YckC